MVQAGCILWIPTVCGLTSCGPCWRDLFKGSSKFLIFRCRSSIKPILEQEEKMSDREMRSLSWFQHLCTSQQCGHRRLSTKSYCIILYQCHLIILLIHSMRDNFKRISVSAFVQMPKKKIKDDLETHWKSWLGTQAKLEKVLSQYFFHETLYTGNYRLFSEKNSCQRFMLCLALIHIYSLGRIYLPFSFKITTT